MLRFNERVLSACWLVLSVGLGTWGCSGIKVRATKDEEWVAAYHKFERQRPKEVEEARKVVDPAAAAAPREKNFAQRFLDDYNKQVADDVQARRDEFNGYKTRTAASLIFVPELRVVQPALVQSFSIRNFIQTFQPNWDPVDQRTKVMREATLYLSGATGSTSSLQPVAKATLNRFKTANPNYTHDELNLFAEMVVEERQKSNYWWTRSDILSIDVGLATNVTLGDASAKFEKRVDEDMPMFLFGGGLHWGGFEASAGGLLFREKSEGFDVTYYVGLSIDLFQTVIQFSSSESTGTGS